MSTCKLDSDCPFLYACQNLKCHHKDIFPLEAYPIFVYCLMPICSGLVNFTGNSMGIFKVLLLMTMLRYDVEKATSLIQAMVVGTALPNFASIIFKRHPTQETTLVNFDIVYILIPCSLYGSTIGSLLQKFLPQLVQNALIILIFSYFAYRFFLKLKTIRNAAKQKLLLKQSLITENNSIFQNKPRRKPQWARLSVRSHDQQRKRSKLDTLSSRSRLKRNADGQSYSSQASNDNKSSQNANSVQGQQPILINNKQQQNSVKSFEEEVLQEDLNLQFQKQKQQSQQNAIKEKLYNKIQVYEKSMHCQDILVSFGVFLFFEFFVFLVQGKLPFYEITPCDFKYIIGLLGLTVLIAGYLFFIRRYLQRKFKVYQRVNYPKDLRLKSKRLFSIVCVGGLASGLVQGVLGVGSGTSTMAVLLYLNLNPRAASATSGYQILFIGLAALLQLFINDSITLIQAGFLVGICSILGGIFTILGYNFFSRFQPVKVNKFLVTLMLALCLFSVVLVVPSVIISYLDFGIDSLISISWKC